MLDPEQASPEPSNRLARGLGLFTQSIPAPLLVLGRERKILAANDLAASILGNEPEALRGAAIDEILEGLPAELVPDPGDQPATVSSSPRLATQHPRPGDKPIELIVRCSRAPGSRKDLVTMLIEDPSRTDVELQRYVSELEQTTRDLEQFVYGASHDLHEPLRVIRGHLQLLERRLGDDLPADEKVFLEFATDAAKRMQRLLDGLLMFSRAGMQEASLELVDVQEMLEEAMANLSASIEEAGAEITWDPMPELLADRTQLTLLFQNLISNAIKFRGDEAPRVHVCATETDGGWSFQVKDNGIGIEPEHQDQLFALFRRLHSQDEYEGSGIGLALCKRIVERHGGSIWVESEPGQGSAFLFNIVTLPRSGQPAEAERAPELPDRGGAADAAKRPLRIVLIDDVAGIRELVRIALEEEGEFDVVAQAADGPTGIDAVREHQPDLVLLDLSMPGMDGLEALPEILRLAPETRVAIYSGFQEERLARQAEGLGAVAYLEKGAEPVELRERLLEVAHTRSREHGSSEEEEP